jgi:hypothetical protein
LFRNKERSLPSHHNGFSSKGEALVMSVAVVAIFCVFAGVLAWVDYYAAERAQTALSRR